MEQIINISENIHNNYSMEDIINGIVNIILLESKEEREQREQKITHDIVIKKAQEIEKIYLTTTINRHHKCEMIYDCIKNITGIFIKDIMTKDKRWRKAYEWYLQQWKYTDGEIGNNALGEYYEDYLYNCTAFNYKIEGETNDEIINNLILHFDILYFSRDNINNSNIYKTIIYEEIDSIKRKYKKQNK